MVPSLLISRFLRRSRTCSYIRNISITCTNQNDNLNTTLNESSALSKKKRMDDYFIDRRVQEILLKITNIDLQKVFRPRKEKLKTPLIKFVTDKQLEDLRQQSLKKAMRKLQMPPVMEIRGPADTVISYDPQLQGFEENPVLFIDISANGSDRHRLISVREPDGTLRFANWEERFRMTQMFFPREGRSLIVPELFQSPHLDKLLDEGSYMFVLDKTCMQFDPDDPEYHRVTHATYERINSNKQFNILRSTRYFGPMSFYLAWNQKIEKLLVDMIEREKIEDAADLVRLLYIFHPKSSLQTEDVEPLHIVKDFINKNVSTSKADLELALQTYIEVQEREMQQDSA